MGEARFETVLLFCFLRVLELNKLLKLFQLYAHTPTGIKHWPVSAFIWAKNLSSTLSEKLLF